jgi:hypothetical protein
MLNQALVPQFWIFLEACKTFTDQEWFTVQDMAGFTEMCATLSQQRSASKAQSRVKRNGDARLKSQADFVGWAG